MKDDRNLKRVALVNTINASAAALDEAGRRLQRAMSELGTARSQYGVALGALVHHQAELAKLLPIPEATAVANMRDRVERLASEAASVLGERHHPELVVEHIGAVDAASAADALDAAHATFGALVDESAAGGAGGA